MKTSSEFWPHMSRVVSEEVVALLSRRVIVELSAQLPAQSLCRTRTAMLRSAGMKIGASSLIQGPMRITGEGNPCESISIGIFTLISGAIHCDVGAPISIGNQVRIGHDVTLLTVDHEIGPREMRSGHSKFGAIEIGDGAWLASRVVVLPGVRIGEGAIVGAGSVVTRDVPANTLAVGVPARVVRDLGRYGDSDLHDALPAPVSGRRFLNQARASAQ